MPNEASQPRIRILSALLVAAATCLVLALAATVPAQAATPLTIGTGQKPGVAVAETAPPT